MNNENNSNIKKDHEEIRWVFPVKLYLIDGVIHYFGITGPTMDDAETTLREMWDTGFITVPTDTAKMFIPKDRVRSIELSRKREEF